jgi:WhiB family redox-sensing transcriptional regulator
VTHYNGSIPDTRRWRDAGACNGEDPDLFAPDGTTGRWALRTAQAKAICGRCPVRTQCLEWALDTRQEYGIYGGLTEDERWNLRRRQARNTRQPTQKPRGPKQPPPNTLRELFDRHTSPTTGGHLMWTGAKTPEFQQRQLTPNQISYLVDRGHEWNGTIHRLCDVRGCVQPLHLADTQERHQRAAAAVRAVA